MQKWLNWNLKGNRVFKSTQITDNRGNFRRPNNTPQIIQRDQRNRDDQNIQTPLQNNLVIDEGEEEDAYPEIHCLGDTSSFPHLTRFVYEESLMDNRLNEMTKGDMTSSQPNRYNLKSRKKEGKLDIPK